MSSVVWHTLDEDYDQLLASNPRLAAEIRIRGQCITELEKVNEQLTTDLAASRQELATVDPELLRDCAEEISSFEAPFMAARYKADADAAALRALAAKIEEVQSSG